MPVGDVGDVRGLGLHGGLLTLAAGLARLAGPPTVGAWDGVSDWNRVVPAKAVGWGGGLLTTPIQSRWAYSSERSQRT